MKRQASSLDSSDLPAATATAKYSSDGEGSTISVFGYTGQLYLSQLQLYYYKARMYSPKTARFVQPDPIGYSDGMNLFAYVGNDPINSRDPFGMQEDSLPGWCVQTTGSCPAMPEFVVIGCGYECKMQHQLASQAAWLAQEQTARAREMLANAADYAVIGAGALLIAFDVYNTATVVFAGPDTSLIGGPMIATATTRLAERGSTKVLGELSIAAGQRGTIGTIFKTSHYASRLEAAGVNVTRAEAAVGKEVAAMRAHGHKR